VFFFFFYPPKQTPLWGKVPGQKILGLQRLEVIFRIGNNKRKKNSFIQQNRRLFSGKVIEQKILGLQRLDVILRSRNNQRYKKTTRNVPKQLLSIESFRAEWNANATNLRMSTEIGCNNSQRSKQPRKKDH